MQILVTPSMLTFAFLPAIALVFALAAMAAVDAEVGTAVGATLAAAVEAGQGKVRMLACQP